MISSTQGFLPFSSLVSLKKKLGTKLTSSINNYKGNEIFTLQNLHKCIVYFITYCCPYPALKPILFL